MNALRTSVAGLALAAGVYFAVQTATKPPDRKASFACWWSPGGRTATVTWRFGARPPGVEIVSDVTRNAPFGRKTKGLHVGDTVNVKIKFGPGQVLTGPGLRVACVVKAGANAVPFQDEDHLGIDRTVIVA